MEEAASVGVHLLRSRESSLFIDVGDDASVVARLNRGGLTCRELCTYMDL